MVGTNVLTTVHPTMTQLLASRPSHTRPAGAARPQLATQVEHWLDDHALAIDSQGEPVTSPFLADDVVAYQIGVATLHADSSDAELDALASQLAAEHFATPGQLRAEHAAPVCHALAILRDELRQQPRLHQPA